MIKPGLYDLRTRRPIKGGHAVVNLNDMMLSIPETDEEQEVILIDQFLQLMSNKYTEVYVEVTEGLMDFIPAIHAHTLEEARNIMTSDHLITNEYM